MFCFLVGDLVYFRWDGHIVDRTREILFRELAKILNDAKVVALVSGDDMCHAI